jgi:hypothetical protein
MNDYQIGYVLVISLGVVSIFIPFIMTMVF